MANDERTTMSRLDVGFARVFLGDTPSQPVNSTKKCFFFFKYLNLAVLGCRKLPGNRLSMGCKNKTAGEPHNRTSDLESPSRELSNEHLRGGI
jgi:hypothetical protein